MAELVAALGLIALLLLLVMGLFVRLNVSSSKSTDKAVALELASKVLEIQAGSSPPLWELEAQKTNAAQGLELRAPGSNTNFYYTFSYQRISDASDSQMGDLYRLDVSVHWWPESSKADHTRGSYGRLQVHLARVVFVEQFR